MIDEIMIQGEGAQPGSADPQAHVNIFRRIRDEFIEELAIDEDFHPGRR